MTLQKESVDAALLVMTPESESVIRGNNVWIPNFNVMFEFGYFYGHLGASKTAIIRYSDFYTPTDLAGYTHITGSKFFSAGKAAAVGKKTESSFNRWLAAI